MAVPGSFFPIDFIARRDLCMRSMPLVLLLSFIALGDAQAQRWCAITMDGAHGDCTFASIGACRDTVSGNGGSCIPAAPVGHAQPGFTGRRASAQDDKLEAAIDRLNRKNDTQQICRGC
jgi:hypothetical protein